MEFIRFLIISLLVWGCVKKECVPIPATDPQERPLVDTLGNPPPIVLRTTVLQSKAVIEDAEIMGYGPNRDINYDSSTSLYTSSKKILEEYVDINGLIKFRYPENLTKNTKIKGAKLILFTKELNIDPSVRLIVKKVSEPWSASTVTYNNQPIVSEKNKVIKNLKEENESELTFTFDVTEIVIDQLKTSNNGFFLCLSTYSSYTDINFYSSECEFPSLYPKLEIEYLD